MGKDSLVIGIDVGSEKQYARAFGLSQIEYTRKAFGFINSAEGFDQFLKWAQSIQQKDDSNDPWVLAKLVFDRRYFYAYRPKGIYAELRVGFTRWCEIMEHLVETKNRISRWFNIYFPEYM